jgi:hypothetical protein
MNDVERSIIQVKNHNKHMIKNILWDIEQYLEMILLTAIIIECIHGIVS